MDHPPRNPPPPTISRIAEEAGVSRATVSRALARPEMLRAETVERVRAVARRIGYVPNGVARALSTGRHCNIALIVPDIANPFFPPLIRSVQAAADQAGFSVFLGDSDEDPVRERLLADKLSRQVDGFVLASSRLSEAAIRGLAATCPLVLINRDVAGLPRVLIDVEPGMTAAIRHLAGLGHRHVVYISGPAVSWSNEQRHRALAQAAEQCGMTVTVVPAQHPTFAAGRAVARAVLATGASATVTFDDFVAHGLLAGLAECGVSVPTDFSVIGCDDVLGACTYPALTSITASCGEAGRKAMALLLSAMAEEGASDAPCVLPTDLAVRATTGRAKGR